MILLFSRIAGINSQIFRRYGLMIRLMKTAVRYRTAGIILLIVIAAAAAAYGTASRNSSNSPETVIRPGGLEIVLDGYPGSGSVLVAVAVRAGSAWETSDTRGVTHFLEHLLFDGSERFSREDISGWVDDNGAFLNAFTRKEVTVYFLLARSDLLEESIEILSQMLLHPVFTPAEIEKERKVVLEEMSQGLDDPREAVSRAADIYLYRGSPLIEPVIGYPSTIESVSRDRIIEYYRSRYTPGRMRIFVTGDFERSRTLGWIDDYFTAVGSTGGGSVKSSGKRRDVEEPVLEPRWSGQITARVVEGAGGRVDLLIRMPAAGEKLFPAALLLAGMLGSPSSPLKEAADQAGLPEPSVGLEVHEDFSALRVGVEGQSNDPVDPERLLEAITGLAEWKPDDNELERAKISFASTDMFDRERYHFYVMLNGEAMAVTGAGWFTAVSAVERVKPGQIAKLVSGYLGEPEFNGFSAIPRAPDVRMERGKTVFETLSGGMAAGVRRREGSPVEALCILFPGRACAGHMESDAVSALFIILENSAGGRRLKEDLASIGARIQWGDNPYIPMDDYLINPAWAFIRLEVPAGRMREAAGMLQRFLSEYEMPQVDIDAAAPFVAKEVRIRSGHSSAAVKKTVYKGLFPDHRFGEALFRSAGRWAATDSACIIDTRRTLFQYRGSVVTLVTAMDEAGGIEILRDIFGDAFVSNSVPCRKGAGDYEPGTVDGDSPGSGAYLAAAWRVDNLSAEEMAALAVACEILSRRMQLDIRETRGLAYSTGCSMTQVGGYAVISAGLGTRGVNADKAEKALRENIEGISADPVTAEEAATAKSRLVSRLSRRELSCAGEAFGICLDRLYRGGTDRYGLIVAAPFESVRELAGRLAWGKALFVRLLPGENATEKRSMPPGMMRR